MKSFKNEVSRSLPSVLFNVIWCHRRLYRDEKMFVEVRDQKFENSSGLQFFVSQIFDQCRWKLRKESHSFATKENDNQSDFGTAF